MRTYEISGKTFDNLNRPVWNWIANRKSLKTAFTKAKKESLANKFKEIDVRGFDKLGELISHHYFNKGRLTDNMNI